MKIADWEYIDNSIDDVKDFRVIPNVQKQKPDTLFKYYSINCFSVDALENGYIYAPHRWQLNDPFDCHKDLLNFSELTSEDKDLIKYTPNDATNEGIFYGHFYKLYGIISMTDCPTNILMWAHYANNSGFVVEYNVKKFDPTFFQGPFPINYREDFETVSVKSGNKMESFLYHTNVKYDVWKYESEWRFITFKKEIMPLIGLGQIETPQSNRKFKIKDTLLSITLGSHFLHLKNDIPYIDEVSNVIYIKVVGDKLKILKYAVNNNLDTYWIVPPDISDNKSYNLLRKKITIRRKNEDEFILTIDD